MNSKINRHTVDILFVLTLFIVFAFSVIMLTGTGANVYQKIVDNMSENFNSRTSYSYFINKIHQSDAEGNISTGTFGDSSALLISEEIENVPYSTYLYVYDGHIKEMFVRSGQEFDPAYGNNILEVESFEVSGVTPSLFRFDITPKGGTKESLFVHIRSERQD